MYRLISACYASMFNSIIPQMSLILRRKQNTDTSVIDRSDDESNSDDDELMFVDIDHEYRLSRCISNVLKTDDDDDDEGGAPAIFVERPETPYSTNSSPIMPIDQLLGKIVVTIQYVAKRCKLDINIIEGVALQLIDNDSFSQVRLTLLPGKHVKYRTKFVQGPNPIFNETFGYTDIGQEQLSTRILRFYVYRRRTNSRHHQLLAIASLNMCMIDARNGTNSRHMLALTSPIDTNSNLSPARRFNHHSPSPSSTVNDHGRYCSSPNTNGSAELLVSLCYDDTIGKLSIGVERGSSFGIYSKLPDTIVHVIALSPYGEEIGKYKTQLVKSSNDPVYDETIPSIELDYMSLLIQVYTYLGVWRRKVLLGWISVGQNSTSIDEQNHWHMMVQSMGTSVAKWHRLIQP